MTWNRLRLALLGLAACAPSSPAEDPADPPSEPSYTTTLAEPTSSSGEPTSDAPPDDTTGSSTDASSSSVPETDTESEPEPEPWPEGEGPPTQGWFVFAGKPVGQLGSFDCVYRWEPEGPPTQLWCGAEEPDVRLRHALPPRLGSEMMFVATEELALDIYPEALLRIDVRDGAVERIAEWPGDRNGGTAVHVVRIFAVDDACVAVQLQRQPFGASPTDVLHVACVDVGLGDPILERAPNKELLGVLDDGRLLVRLDPGGFVVVDPQDDSSTTISALPPGAFAHDGQRVAVAAGVDLQNEVRVWDEGDVAVAGDLVGASPSLGFAPNGDVLVGATEVARWNGMDGAAVTALHDSPIAHGYGAFLRVGAYTGVQVSETDLAFGIAFASDTHVSPVCGADQWGRNLALVHASDEVLLVHTDIDPRSAARFHIFSCRPGGEPVDLLDGHDLVGTTLPADWQALAAGYDA